MAISSLSEKLWPPRQAYRHQQRRDGRSGRPQGGWGRISGLLWTENGLFVADAQLGQVFSLKPDHTWVRIIPPGLKLNKGIRTMAADPKEESTSLSTLRTRVLRIDPQSGSVAVFAGTGEPGLAREGAISTEAPLRSPDGLAFDQEGKLLVADSGNRRICRIDVETGQISTFASSDTSGSDDKWTPGSIAVDASGSVWVGDSERDHVLRFSSGALTPKVFGKNEDLGDGGPAIQARLAHPSSVVSDLAGNIYISDTLHHRIRVVNAKDGRISTVAGTGIPGYNGDNIPADTARLNYPAHIQIDNRGKLYVGDYYNTGFALWTCARDASPLLPALAREETRAMAGRQPPPHFPIRMCSISTDVAP